MAVGDLQRTVDELVAAGALPGALVGTLEDGMAHVVRGGHADLARSVLLTGRTRFRLASVTKPIVAALALALVEDGLLALDDPIAAWVPELGAPTVVRRAQGPVEDVELARRAVTLRHLVASTSGWGFGAQLDAPASRALLDALGDGRDPGRLPAPAAWLAALARVPMLHHPGERWLYETSYDLLGVVLARAAGTALPALLAERLLGPAGMLDTGFAVDPREHDLVAQPVVLRDGALRVRPDVDDATALPAFASAAGGLLSTLDDLVRFASMLLGGGELDGSRVLSGGSVAALTSDQLTREQRGSEGGFLAGQSWGYGGSVDVDPRRPWEALGRYGWLGVTGTSLHVVPAEGTAVVVLTARELRTEADTAVLEALWTAAAARS